METISKELLQDIIGRYEAAYFTVNRRISAMTRELLPDGLTIDQCSTMSYLKERGSCTSSELAEIFCVGKSSITAIVGRLADKRLIRRMPDEKDRRVIYLELTEEGRKLSQDMEAKIAELLGHFIGHFDKQEALSFIETFEKLAQLLAKGPS